MKNKISIFVIVVMTSVFTAKSQERLYGQSIKKEISFIGLGLSLHNIDSDKESFLLTAAYRNFYFDFSSNFVKGSGSYLRYVTNYQEKLDAKRVSTINMGYVVMITEYLGVIPYIGLTYSMDIYQNYATYYEEFSGTKPNIGVQLLAVNKDDVGVTIGVGLEQRFVVSIIVKL